MYSTTFSRMSTTTYGPVSVSAGKTGYTEEARFCLATLAARPDGREYVLVTVGGSTKYTPVSDCDAVYGKYLF
jgi:D-alanyl-D-alanine carboxypeptidase (penicillin-binding protein 5/6)